MRMPDIYRPLLDRTVENYQVQHLVRKFDFGKESRIARLIVQAINAAVEQEEANLRITRVRPFELFITANRQSVCLPLFQDDYTAPLYQGQSFATAKKLVRENCLNRLRQALVSNYVRNFHRVSKWFKPPGGSPEFVQG
ncbi:MAG: hypothetical protein ACOX44_12025 [Limnochordia bacterium]